MAAVQRLAQLSGPEGSIYLDARGAGRALRVSWHHEADLVVISLWREKLCTGTFRLTVDEVPALIEMLRAGLDHSYARSVRPRTA